MKHSIHLFLTACLVISCSDPARQEESELTIDSTIKILKLDYNDLYYTYHTEAALDENFPKDSNGVRLSEVRGNFYYHPVSIFHKGIEYHDLYHITSHEDYLQKSIIQASGLISVMTSEGFLPYMFSHSHGMTTLEVPWYSGMAQGQALSLFSRLYIDTDNSAYLEAAATIFSTLNPKHEISKELLFFDEDDYLWIEEYPLNYPDLTLNGFMFAIFGLYDYYQLTDDSEVRDVLLATLTTIKNKIGGYRVEGGISMYCMAHNIQNPVYHKIHIAQLRYLTLITDDSTYADVAELLVNDYWDY